MAEPPSKRKRNITKAFPACLVLLPENFATSWALMWEGNHPVRETISNIGNKGVAQNIHNKHEPEKIIACLVDTDWASIGMIRIDANDNTSDPIFLWVGVKPGILSWVKGLEVARRCRRVLLEA
ncbi:hypothetical protein OQA88_5215 [Cercophora sp. LCS_1]